MADPESPDLKPTSSRKRASKACLACRARKVRCDVSQRSTPCTNCFLDKQECVVRPRPTKYRVHKPRVETAPRNSGSLPTTTQDAHKVTNNDQNWHRQMPTTAGLDTSEEFPDYNGQFDIPDEGGNISDHSVEELDRESPTQPELHTGSHPILGDSNAAFDFVDSPEQIDSESRSTLDSHVMFSYYPFLELDILSHMSSQDVNFLEQSGCFRVPTRPALDEFVREYFLHVHPSLPMLDEGEFWENYAYRGVFPAERPRMSLFVFQAMLFASCSFVSLEAVRGLGFSSIRSARGAYYRRAKLLFDFNGERDAILTSQGALLLSYNSSMRNLKRVNTFWLGISIHFAKDADAHRYHTNKCLTPNRRNSLKRLWWCCILRDRILPLGVRRPLHISSVDFDFGAAPLAKEDFQNEITRSKVYDAATKQSLTKIFITLCDLAIVLTDVIMVVYPLSDYSDSSISGDIGAEQALDRVATCKSGLNYWFERATLFFPTPAGLGDMHGSVILYTNLMYMYYHSAVIALCNHEVFILATRAKQGESRWDLMCESKRQLEEGTAGMTENLKELIQLKLSKYMPISVVAYAALPLVLHILDVKLSNTPSQSARKQGRLNIYTEAMKALKSQYDGTDEVSGFIGRMIDYISLENPHSQSYGVNVEKNHNSRRSAAWLTSSRSATSVNGWSDVLLRQPSLYSRLILTIDLSLANSKFPEDIDFPMALQSKSVFGSRFPLYRIALGAHSNPDVDAQHRAQNTELSHRQLDPQSQHTQNDFTTSDFGASDGYEGQMHMHQSGNPLNVNLDLPMYHGTFDMGLHDGTSVMLDNPAVWADRMFSEAT